MDFDEKTIDTNNEQHEEDNENINYLKIMINNKF